MMKFVFALLCVALVAALPLIDDSEFEGNSFDDMQEMADVQMEAFPSTFRFDEESMELAEANDNPSEWLNAHNDARRNVSPTAADMTEMVWDDALATIARNYANQCIWQHNAARSSTYSGYVGENLAAGTSMTPAYAVKMWDDEKAEYNYNTKACSGVCGHYTQVAWSRSTKVGCATKYCSSIQGLSWGGNIMVCNYAPGGNYNGEAIYQAGATCSNCPSGTSCVNGLCSTGSGGSSTASPTPAPTPVATPAPTSGGSTGNYQVTALTADSLASMSYFCYQYYYAYRNGNYYRYNIDTPAIQNEYTISSKSGFSGDVDAAVEINPDASSLADKVTVFIKGTQFVKKSPYCTSCSASTQPAPLSQEFPGMTFPVVDDAAVKKGTNHMYVFLGGQYSIYDLAAKREIKPPTSIATDFPGLGFSSVDAVSRPRHCSGDFIMTKGADYKCYSLASKQVTQSGKWASIFPQIAPGGAAPTPAPTPAPTAAPPSPPSGGCSNISPDSSCTYWANAGYCSHSYVAYMRAYCAKACGCPTANIQMHPSTTDDEDRVSREEEQEYEEAVATAKEKAAAERAAARAERAAAREQAMEERTNNGQHRGHHKDETPADIQTRRAQEDAALARAAARAERIAQREAAKEDRTNNGQHRGHHKEETAPDAEEAVDGHGAHPTD